MMLRLLLGLIIIGCAIVVLMRAEPLPRRSSNASFGFFGLLSGVPGADFSASGRRGVSFLPPAPWTSNSLRGYLIAAWRRPRCCGFR